MCGSVRLTYAQVDAAANQVANLLVSRGIEPGDKVALTCPNLPFFPIVYYGILKAGAVVVPLNVLFKAREVAYHLNDSEAVAYFCFEGPPDLPMGSEGWDGFAEAAGCEHFFLIEARPGEASGDRWCRDVRRSRRGDGDDVRDPGHGAGRHGRDPVHERHDGQPKGAELSHSNIGSQRLDEPPALPGRPAQAGHGISSTLPLFHSFGQTVQLNAGFGAGATLVLLPAVRRGCGARADGAPRR